jgi:hypothetical protein
MHKTSFSKKSKIVIMSSVESISSFENVDVGVLIRRFLGGKDGPRVVVPSNATSVGAREGFVDLIVGILGKGLVRSPDPTGSTACGRWFASALKKQSLGEEITTAGWSSTVTNLPDLIEGEGADPADKDSADTIISLFALVLLWRSARPARSDRFVEAISNATGCPKINVIRVLKQIRMTSGTEDQRKAIIHSIGAGWHGITGSGQAILRQPMSGVWPDIFSRIATSRGARGFSEWAIPLLLGLQETWVVAVPLLHLIPDEKPIIQPSARPTSLEDGLARFLKLDVQSDDDSE